MINLNNIKYNYIFIITILFFSFIGIIQKGYADNSITKTKNECEIIKSYNKDYTTIYHYTDDGEMAEHNIPNKKMNAIIKTYMLDPLPASASIVLYDKYKNKIGKFYCNTFESYESCKKKNPILIESYYDKNNNKIEKYLINEKNKAKLINAYMFNPQNQLVKKYLKYNGSMSQYVYNSNNELISEYYTDYVNNIKYNKIYQYDKNKNIIRKDIENVDIVDKKRTQPKNLKNDTYYESYEYDKKNNLIFKKINLPTISYTDKFIHEYDLKGNITKTKEYRCYSCQKYEECNNCNFQIEHRYKYDEYGNLSEISICGENGNCHIDKTMEYKCR